MECQPAATASHDFNWTALEFNFTFSFHKPEQAWYNNAEYVIKRHVTSYICLFGMFGNLINLAVLSRKSLMERMERMERASHVGLIALAVSDFLYCTCSFPQAYVGTVSYTSGGIDFWLVYQAYGFASMNCFLLTSTWLTVAMAVCRYLAICYPLRARQYLGMTASRAIICSVFALSLIFNLPRFFFNKITCTEYPDLRREYTKIDGAIPSDSPGHVTYMWLYFIFGILLPLLVLAYCNIFLVRALHESRHLRRQHSSSTGQNHDSTRIVTLTLCVIVVMYILLVGPAELVTFWRLFVDKDTLNQYNFAVRICNALQMLNFAVNFILYCIINVHFRRVVRDLLLCQHLREQIHSHAHSCSEASKPATPEAVAML
jgi:hypothetical protein